MRFLFVDRMIESIPGQVVRGIKHVVQDEAFLHEDASGLRYFAPALIGEAIGQLAAWPVMAACDFKKRPVAGVVAGATLLRPVYAGETLQLEAHYDGLDEVALQYHGTAYVDGTPVFKVDGALGPMLPMSDFIAESIVRRQYAMINRPGVFPPKPTTDGFKSARAPRVAPAESVFSFDGIAHLEPDVTLTAFKRISQNAPYFPDHFPDNPVLPLTVLLACQQQLWPHLFTTPDSWYLQGFEKIKMNGFVRPGDTLFTHLTCQLQSDDTIVLRSKTEVDDRRVCHADMILRRKECVRA